MEDSGSSSSSRVWRVCDIGACVSPTRDKENTTTEIPCMHLRERKKRCLYVTISILTLTLIIIQSNNMQWDPHVTYGIDVNEEEDPVLVWHTYHGIIA